MAATAALFLPFCSVLVPPASEAEGQSGIVLHARHEDVNGLELPLGAEACSPTLRRQALEANAQLAGDHHLQPLVLECEKESPDGTPELDRQESEWSFLSQSLRTVDSIELNELESSDEDRPLPSIPRWRRVKNFFWPKIT
jgi:hypothetical protein